MAYTTPDLGFDYAALEPHIDEATMRELFLFPRDMTRVEAPVNRLNDQQLVATYVREWARWPR